MFPVQLQMLAFTHFNKRTLRVSDCSLTLSCTLGIFCSSSEGVDALLAPELDDGLHNGGVCKGGCVAKLVIFLHGYLAQDAPHYLS